jgi:rhomboid protease GluP
MDKNENDENLDSTTMAPALATRLQTSYTRLTATWLSRKPDSASFFAAASSTSALLLGSLIYWNNIGGAAAMMPASRQAVFHDGEIWRLWTALFAHGDLGHLASNTLLFFILGFFLYGYFGLRLFPIGALICGAAANALALSTYDPQVQLLGASGIVYWMGGTWLILYFFLSRQKNLTHRMVRTFGVALLLFAPSGALENQAAVEQAMHTSHITHFAGFMLGILTGFVDYAWNRKMYRSAETYETIVEESDPDEDLPPASGFPPQI